VTVPVCAVSLRLRSCLIIGSRGGVACDADEFEGIVVDQPEIGAAYPDRQVLGQMPIRAKGAYAELSDRVWSSMPPNSLSEMNMSVPV